MLAKHQVPTVRKSFRSFDGSEVAEGSLARPERYRDLMDALSTGDRVIPRGAGLSYCNASAGDGVCSVTSRKFNRVLAFDTDRGRITVETGLTVGDLVGFLFASGWHLPVVPGHPKITVGGCIGCNVHGKGHTRTSTFRSSIERLRLFHPHRGEIVCSEAKEPDLFLATIGGFGLTGFVTEATLRLQPTRGNLIRRMTVPVENLLDSVQVMEQWCDQADAVYSWNDLNRAGPGFGCGVVYVEKAEGGVESDGDSRRYPDLTPESRSSFPVAFWNGWSTRMMTRAYGTLARLRTGPVVIPSPIATFPIAGKEIYFKLFGRKGLREYQMLVPTPAWPDVVREIERARRRHGVACTLGSLKLFHGEGSLLHFDGKGVCLAVDAPPGPATICLWSELDEIVSSVGGRVNLAKDSRLEARVVEGLFPEYGQFRGLIERFDPEGLMTSSLRERILG